jgi:hypothetical protein
MFSQFESVTVVKKANVYFDGRCISHTIILEDGARKSVGVILPSKLTFNTGVAEIMEVIAGTCRVRLAGEKEWKHYGEGQHFAIPGNSSFDIEAITNLHYVCHFS